MPKNVYFNVEDQRILDNSRVVEDVTSFTPPDVEHPTTEFDVAGMAGTLNFPNQTKVNAMELTIAHNNGNNCDRLIDLGKHVFEMRLARQRYDTAKADVGHSGVKYRFTAQHVRTEDGTVERGNPLGSTEHYSVQRYEKIVNGKTVLLIDITANKITVNGKSPTDEVENLLK